MPVRARLDNNSAAVRNFRFLARASEHKARRTNQLIERTISGLIWRVRRGKGTQITSRSKQRHGQGAQTRSLPLPRGLNSAAAPPRWNGRWGHPACSPSIRHDRLRTEFHAAFCPSATCNDLRKQGTAPAAGLAPGTRMLGSIRVARKRQAGRQK